MALDQIQIISTPKALQELFDNSLLLAVERLKLAPILENDKNEKPISTKELCNFLGVTEPTIIRWRKKGKIPFMQIGSAVRFNLSAVISALEVKKKAKI